MTTTREKAVSVRFSKPELEQISQQAKLEGLKLSQWLRRLALTNSTSRKDS